MIQRHQQQVDRSFTLSKESSALLAAQQEEAAKLAAEELRYV